MIHSNSYQFFKIKAVPNHTETFNSTFKKTNAFESYKAKKNQIQPPKTTFLESLSFPHADAGEEGGPASSPSFRP